MNPLLQKIRELKNSKKIFADFKSDIARYNLRTLRQISWIGLIVGFLLTIACIPPFHLLDSFYEFLAITLLFGTLVLLSYTLMKKFDRIILPVYYVLIAALLTLSIVMGTFFNATAFEMLLLTLPMFIIDRPCRLNLLFGGLSIVFCVVDVHSKTGPFRNFDISNCIVFYLLGVVISRHSIRSKMTDIVIKRKLKQQRDMDMLTKLNNRGAFERIVEKHIHESSNNAVMLLMDIDNFKSVNDTMGHAYGDMILQLAGEYLKATFRESDIVSRLGGDEFAAFLPAVTDINVIRDKAAKLIEQIKSIPIQSEQSCNIGASIGLAQYPKDGSTFEELYKRADSALYYVKRNAKGQCVLYDAVSMAVVSSEQKKL